MITSYRLDELIISNDYDITMVFFTLWSDLMGKWIAHPVCQFPVLFVPHARFDR